MNYEIKGDLYAIGDIHGDQGPVYDACYDICSTGDSIVLLGDIGLGFGGTNGKDFLEGLARIYRKCDVTLYLIRGNHDNPAVWELPHSDIRGVVLLRAGDTIEVPNAKYLIVPGSISLDRENRVPGFNYWEDEVIDFVNPDDESITGILSHVGPRPPDLPLRILDFWTSQDEELTDDLKTENDVIDNIMSTINPKKWYFGHYHVSKCWDMQGCRLRCVDCDKVIQIYDSRAV